MNLNYSNDLQLN